MARTQSKTDGSEEQRGVTQVSGREACEGHTTEATSQADVETVHTTADWTLVVRADGAVEARTHWPNGDLKTFTTAPEQEAPEPSATYRYGKSIEKVLARYAHETRFERDTHEHGGALRDGIITALQSVAPTTFPDESDRQPVGVVHVNAPTGPSTYIVSEDGIDTGTYATFYPFEECRERGEGNATPQ